MSNWSAQMCNAHLSVSSCKGAVGILGSKVYCDPTGGLSAKIFLRTPMSYQIPHALGTTWFQNKIEFKLDK